MKNFDYTYLIFQMDWSSPIILQIWRYGDLNWHVNTPPSYMLYMCVCVYWVKLYLCLYIPVQFLMDDASSDLSIHMQYVQSKMKKSFVDNWWMVVFPTRCISDRNPLHIFYLFYIFYVHLKFWWWISYRFVWLAHAGKSTRGGRKKFCSISFTSVASSWLARKIQKTV